MLHRTLRNTEQDITAHYIATWSFKDGTEYHNIDCLNNKKKNNDSNHIERCNSRFLQSPHCAANCLRHVCSGDQGTVMVQTTCNTRSTYHMQHVTCHVVGRDSSAIKFGRVEISFILASFYWLKPLAGEGKKSRERKAFHPARSGTVFVDQTSIGIVRRATSCKLLRDGPEGIWAFRSVTMPSWDKNEMLVPGHLGTEPLSMAQLNTS